MSDNDFNGNDNEDSDEPRTQTVVETPSHLDKLSLTCVSHNWKY